MSSSSLSRYNNIIRRFLVHFSGIFTRVYNSFITSGFFDKFINKKLSVSVFWLIVVYVSVYNINSGHWKDINRTMGSDVKGYYTYLPAVVLYNDLNLNFIYNDFDLFKDRVWSRIAPNGSRVVQFTYGLAFLYLPFFLIAQLISILFGLPLHGYNVVNGVLILIGSVFYFAAGLHFLRKLLLKYFNQRIVSFVLLSIVLGSNLFYYITYEATMSHSFSFALFAVFLFYLDYWVSDHKVSQALILGFTSGLIILIRPSNGILLVLFLLWNIDSFQSLKKRIFLLFGKYYQVLIIIGINILFWLPQMFYWHYLTGDYFYFSYGEDQTFFFKDPEISNVLFSYRKGWLLYTPIMIFALVGIIALWRLKKGFAIPVLVFTMINLYVISSWYQWWYGGSFGSRPFIESYTLLSFPLAAFYFYIGRSKRIWRCVFFIIIGLLVYFNQFQVKQYINGAIHYANMTKGAYWETFGKSRATEKYYRLLEEPDYEGLKQKVLDSKE